MTWNRQNAVLLLSAALALTGILLIAVLLLISGYRVYDNCKEIEGIKTLIRGTLADSRDAQRRNPNLSMEMKARIEAYYTRELARYHASDCGL